MKATARSAVVSADTTLPIHLASMRDEVRATALGPGTTPDSFESRQQRLSTVFQPSGILYNAP